MISSLAPVPAGLFNYDATIASLRATPKTTMATSCRRAASQRLRLRESPDPAGRRHDGVLRRWESGVQDGGGGQDRGYFDIARKYLTPSMQLNCVTDVPLVPIGWSRKLQSAESTGLVLVLVD